MVATSNSFFFANFNFWLVAHRDFGCNRCSGGTWAKNL